MKNKKNEPSGDLVAKPSSFSHKNSIEFPEEVRFDIGVFAHSRAFFPDAARQNLGSPLSVTSASRESLMVFASAIDIKKGFHSRTNSIPTPMTPHASSSGIQFQTKASLNGGGNIDYSDLGINTEFQTTMYTSMTSNQKKDFGKFTPYAKDMNFVEPKIPRRPQTHNTTKKAGETVSRASRNSSVESIVNSYRSPVANDTYKKGMNNFFNSAKKPAKKAPRPTMMFQGFAQFQSQPSSPVSKKSESVRSSIIKPQKPSTAGTPQKPTNTNKPMLNRGGLSRSQKLFNNKTSLPSSLQNSIRDIKDDISKTQETAMYTNTVESSKFIESRSAIKRTSMDTFGTKNLLDPNENNTDTVKLLTLNSGCLTIREDTIEDDTTKYRAPPATSFHGFINALNAVAKSQNQLEKSQNQKKTSRKSLSQSQAQNNTPSLKNGISEGTQASLKSLSNRQQSKVETTKTKETERGQKEPVAEGISTQTLKIDLKDTDPMNKNARFSPAQDPSPIQAFDTSPITLHQESNFGISEGSQSEARRLFGRLSIISTKNPKILESKPSLQLYLPENNSPKANSMIDEDKKTENSQPQFPSATVSAIEKDFIQEDGSGQRIQITPSSSEKEIILMTSGQQEITPISNKKEEETTPASSEQQQFESSSNKLDEGVIEPEEKEEVLLKVEKNLPIIQLISKDELEENEKEEVIPMVIGGLKKLDLEDNAASITRSSVDSQEGDGEKEEKEENKEPQKEGEDGVQPRLRRSSSLAVFSKIKRDFQSRTRTQIPKSPLDNTSLSAFKNLFADLVAQRERKSSREISLSKSPSKKQNTNTVPEEQGVQEEEEVTAPNLINMVSTIQEDKAKEEEEQKEPEVESKESEKEEHGEGQFLAKRQQSLKKRDLKLFITLDYTEPPTPATQFGSAHTDEELSDPQSAGQGNRLRVMHKQVSLSPNHLHSAMNGGQERKMLFRQPSSSSTVTMDKDGKLSLPFVDTNVFSIVSDRLEPKDEYLPTITIKEFDDQSRPVLFNPSITEEDSRKMSQVSGLSDGKDSFEASYKKAMYSSQKNGRRSNTLEIEHLLSPSARSLEGKTARKSGHAQQSQAQPNSPITSTAEDYIQSFRAAQKKVSFINNGRSQGSGRELTLLRSIMKENEGVMQIERGFKKHTTQAFLSGRLRSPTARSENRAKTFRGQEQPGTPVSPLNDEQESGISAQKSARSDDAPKKEMKRSKTQKSVFAKKDGEKMDAKQFTVKFDLKKDAEGNTPKAPTFSFKNKPKRKSNKAIRKRNSVLLVNQGPSKKVPDDNFLAKLNAMDFEDDLKDFTTIVTPKLRIKVEEPTPLLKGRGNFTFEPQKTFDFSTLLQNDDDDDSRGFGFNMSKAGSVRSDVSKMLQKEREKENKKSKIVIRVFPPESEGRTLETEHKEGEEPQEELEGVSKFEYNMKRKSKGSMGENDLEFSRFENFDDLYENDFNGEVYLGTLDKISSGYDWDRHVDYFSQRHQKTRFLKYFDAITSNPQTFLMKYYEDKVQRYEHMITANEVKPDFAVALRKIMKKTSIINFSQAEDVLEDDNNERSILSWKENVSEMKEIASTEIENEYEDDRESNQELLELNGIRGGLNYPAFSLEVRRQLKRGAHIISQIDDRIQAKIFANNGHTVEDYIMLNGLNFKQISRTNVHHKIAEMLTYSANKNLGYIAKLEGIEYKDLLSGRPQCNFLLKVLEPHQLPISSDKLTPLQKTLPERKRLEKVEKFSRAPSLRHINAPSSKSLKSSPSTSPVNNTRKSVWAKASLARRKISIARHGVFHDSRFEAAQAEEQAAENDAPPVLQGPKFRLQRQMFVDLSAFEKDKEKEKEKDKSENKIKRGDKLLELTPLGTPTNKKALTTLRRLVTGASNGDSTPLLSPPASPYSPSSEQKSFGDRSDEIKVNYFRPGFSRTTPNSPHGSNSSSSPKEANSAWGGIQRSSSFKKKASPAKEPTFLQRVLALGRTEKMSEGGESKRELRSSLKTSTIMPYASRSPSKFKTVVEQLIKKNENKDKFKAVRILLNETGKSFIEGESMMNMSKMHIMQRKGTLIKFDNEKLKVFKEKKMDKGSLRMRTQAHSQQKKKHLTLLQQTFLAVKENKIPELHELFLLCPTSLLDRKDSHGDYLIGIASQCGFLEVVKMLLDKNVNVNFPNAEGNTPLHLALAYGHEEIADRLLARGAEQNVANHQGKLPWDLVQYQ